MSDDERDDSSWMKRYRILKIKGRSRDLELLFRIVDTVERLDRGATSGGATRGKEPRLRFLSNKFSKRTFHFRSLPINLYDSAWLADMEDFEREGLAIDDDSVDLSVSDDMMK